MLHYCGSTSCKLTERPPSRTDNRPALMAATASIMSSIESSAFPVSIMRRINLKISTAPEELVLYTIRRIHLRKCRHDIVDILVRQILVKIHSG